jgi:hypothetical protein
MWAFKRKRQGRDDPVSFLAMPAYLSELEGFNFPSWLSG